MDPHKDIGLAIAPNYEIVKNKRVVDQMVE